MVREWIKANRFNLQVMAIGLAISFVIGLAATGDFSDALARSKR